MRPRFSIRFMLVFVSIIAGAFYLFFVRPIALARQFEQAVQANDYAKAESLCTGAENRFLSKWTRAGGTYRVEVQFLRRQWRNVWNLQQPMLVSVNQVALAPGQKNWIGYHIDVVATTTGIETGHPYQLNLLR